MVILMETALYLIEANQPVYPLDLTRVMRDQRASMIQTPSQYKFVCQVIKKNFLTRLSIISQIFFFFLISGHLKSLQRRPSQTSPGILSNHSNFRFRFGLVDRYPYPSLMREREKNFFCQNI